jgi:hypothetical protein
MGFSQNATLEKIERAKTRRGAAQGMAAKLWEPFRVGGHLLLFVSVLMIDRLWSRVTRSRESSLDKLDSLD